MKTRRSFLQGLGGAVLLPSAASADVLSLLQAGGRSVVCISPGIPTAPVMTWVSAANITTPVFSIVTIEAAAVNDLIQVQVAEDTLFTSVIYDDTHEIVTADLVANAFSPQVGLLTPGPWYARSRFNKTLGWSPWSNTVNQTINTYIGLGDIHPGALGYWGLQAYSAANVGANCVELRRASDNDTEIFALQANGRLDMEAIVGWRDAAGASTAFVKTLYGQNISLNLAQATNSKQPEFVVGEIPFWGAMKFVRASNQYLEATSSGIVSAQPFTIFTNLKRSTTPLAFMGVFVLQSSASAGAEHVRVGAGSPATANGIGAYSGSGSGISIAGPTAGYWNDFCGTFNNTSSAGNANGSASESFAGTTSTDTLVSGAVRIGALADGTEQYDGYISECCVWSGDPGVNIRQQICYNSHDRLRTGY